MKRSKLLASLLSLALVLSMTACGDRRQASTATPPNTPAPASESGQTSSESPSGEPVTLQLWSQFSDPNSTDGNYIAFYKALEAASAAFPSITIEHDGTESEAYKTKLKTSMAANELPDIFFQWGAGTLQPYVEGGLVLPFDDYVNAETKSRVLGGTLENFTFNGKLYGLPYSVAVASLYVNTELFEQNGLKLPHTYADLTAAIDAFKAKGVTPIILGEKDRWPGLMIYGIHAIRMAGTADFQAALDGTGSFETPELIEAARMVQSLANTGAFGENAMGTDQNDAVASFKRGNAAMMFMGSWLNGDAEADDAAVKGKISAMRFPEAAGGKGNINLFHGGSGETFCVGADTKHPQEAVDVAAFICEYMSKEQYLAGSGMPAWEGDMGDTSGLNRLSVEVADLTANAEGYVYWLDSLLGGEKADTLMNEIGKLIVGDVTPEEFCANLQAMNQ